ncbi:MAG: ORF6N domain-containing protein [Bacteroidetes bacterium]|nr:ORF6N domain-containing protein [Bacteroidota bacterium]
MLDDDLAAMYGVGTKRLKEQVRRNLSRFPADFMFELSINEFESLRSQIATSKRGGTRYLPMAFTEQGVAMLSSILNSEKTIKPEIIYKSTGRIRDVQGRIILYPYPVQASLFGREGNTVLLKSDSKRNL